MSELNSKMATETLTYEKQFERLEAISARLNGPVQLSVNDLEALYDEAQQLHHACEQRIEALNKKISGERSTTKSEHTQRG